MAAFFQLLEHHPRFFRRRTCTPGPCTTSPAAPHPPHSRKASNKPAAPASAKAVHCTSKDGRSTQETKACACAKRSASERPPPPGLRLQETANYSRRFKNESPSILDSSRASHTIRESPRKSLDGADSPDDHRCRSTPAVSAGSCRSSPGSPHVRFFKTRDTARSPFVVPKTLLEKPSRACFDGDGQGLQVAAASRVRRRHSHRDRSLDVLCKDPLQELQESISALAKIQQATQKFVDGFEVRQDDPKLQTAADEPAKKRYPANNWWNAGKARLFQRSHSHVAAQNSSMEAAGGGGGGGAAAARTSSFDYTEAIRISQKIQETPARLSLDGRELVPKAVMKLREAMRLGSSSVNTPACKSSECVADKGQRSNIIARLMGLDDLPSSTARQYVSRDAGNTKSKEPRPLKDLLRSFDDHAARPAVLCATDQCMISDKHIRQYDAAMASKLRKIEVASGHAVKNTAHEPLQQGPAIVLSREEDCKVISEVITNFKNSCTLERRPAVVVSKHAMEVMPRPSLVRRTGAVDCHVERAGHSEKETEKLVYYNDPDSVAGFRSELGERKGRRGVQQERICRIVVMKPRKVRTLSMETHFPFDVPSIEKEYLEQLPISCSDHRPKLQAATAADSIRQRDMANHRLDHHKRKCSNDYNQKELAGAGSKHSSPPKSSRPRKSNDQFCKPIAITERGAATPPMSTGNVRYRKQKQQRPEAAGKPVSAEREKMQYVKTKKSASKFSELSYGGTGAAATGKAGGGSKANNTTQQGKQRGGGRTMSMRTGLVRADILESAQQLCLKSHGSCTDREETTQPPSPSLCSSAVPTAELTAWGETADQVVSPISMLDRPDEGGGLLINGGQLEYVEAILERAGLLADKEDVVQSRRRRRHHLLHHLDLGGDRAIHLDPAIFLEIERSWATSGSSCPPAAGSAVDIMTADGRQQRRLIFDCVHEILTENSFGDGCKNGLLLAVWKELKRLVAPAPPSPSSNKPVRLCGVHEWSQEACWSPSPPPSLSFSHHISCYLENAVFQDLLLELII